MNQYKKTIFCFAPLATLLLLSLFAFTSTASATVTPTIDLDASSDTGVSDIDHVTSDNTPTFTLSGFLSGFDNGGKITIYARHGAAEKWGNILIFVDTTDAITVTRTGNGKVTLPTLADGLWSVKAVGETVEGQFNRAITVVTIDTTGKENTHTIDLWASSDDGISDTDDNTGDSTPYFRITGFTYGTPITIIATNTNSRCQIFFHSHISFSERFTRIDLCRGSGFYNQYYDQRSTESPVELPVGVWLITATDGINTTQPLIVTTGRIHSGPDTRPTIDLDTSSDTGVSNTDNITNDNTPTFTVADLHGGERGVVVASNSGNNYVWGSGGTALGEDTMRKENSRALADGVWTVSAWESYTKVYAGSNGRRRFDGITPPITITIDTKQPAITNIGSIGTTTDTTPDLTFTASEAGMLVANSACGITAQEVTEGVNTITLSALAPSTYDTCTLQMIDIAGNTGTAVSIPLFTVNAKEKTTPEPIISDPVLPSVETITTDTLSVDTPSEEKTTPTTPEPVISDPILPSVETITTDTLSADTLASECNTKTQKIKTHRLLVSITEKVNLSDHFSSDLCSLTFSVKTTDKVDAEVKGGDKLLLTANKQDIGGNKVTITAQGANSAMTQTFRVKAYNLPAEDTLTDKQRFIVRKITEHNNKNNYLLVTFWRRAFFDLVTVKEVRSKRAKTEKGTKEYKSLSTLLWHLKQ